MRHILLVTLILLFTQCSETAVTPNPTIKGEYDIPFVTKANQIVDFGDLQFTVNSFDSYLTGGEVPINSFAHIELALDPGERKFILNRGLSLTSLPGQGIYYDSALLNFENKVLVVHFNAIYWDNGTCCDNGNRSIFEVDSAKFVVSNGTN